MLELKNKKAVIILTLVPFAFALYTQVIWSIVATSDSNLHKDAVQAFLSYFPPFLRNIWMMIYATLFCSILTIIFSSIWIRRNSGMVKVMAIIVLIVSILITLLTLFQLM